MTRSTAPTGLIPILATPFTENGELDLPSLRSLVEFQLESRVDGVAVFGMASEGFALTAQERVAILREVRSVTGPDLPIVAGVNATSTAVAIEQARLAENEGADQLMVLPPYLAKPSRQQLLDFFAEVADVSSIAIMIQDAPGVTGVTIDVPAVATLAQTPGITSVKVEAPPTPIKVAAVVSATHGFAVLGGQNANSVIEEYDNGSVGTMPACEFSDVLRTVLDDLAQGRRAQARVAFTRLLPLIHIGMRPGQAWAVHKEVLRRRGIIGTAKVRLPAGDLDPLTARALHEILDELRLPGRTGALR